MINILLSLFDTLDHTSVIWKTFMKTFFCLALDDNYLFSLKLFFDNWTTQLVPMFLHIYSWKSFINEKVIIFANTLFNPHSSVIFDISCNLVTFMFLVFFFVMYDTYAMRNVLYLSMYDVWFILYIYLSALTLYWCINIYIFIFHIFRRMLKV